MKTKIILSLISILFIFACTTANTASQNNKPGKVKTDIAAKLLNTSWELTEINGQEPDFGVAYSSKPVITIEFKDHGMNGRSVVNGYFSSYKINDDNINFGGIGATRMGGPKEFMDLEYKYFNILDKVNKVELPDENTLILKSNTDTLKFTKK